VTGDRNGNAAGISRRDAIKWLAATPALGAIDWSAAQADRAARQLRALAALGDRSPSYAPRFFTPHEWRAVRVLADDVIPRDERSGSATDARVPEFMDVILADADTTDATRTAMRGGLAWLDLACDDRFGTPFADCGESQRRELLDAIAWPKRARPELAQGAAFFSQFRDFSASGFFSSAVGWQDLRYLGNAAVAEWQGCPDAALRKLGVTYAIMDARPSKR
jgi:gluconate 2-dehydrogenase gamma chain